MAEIDVTLVIPPTSNTIVIDPNGAASAALSAITATNQAAAASEDATEAAASAAAALSSQNAAAASAASISIGTPGGVATLDGAGHVPISQIPSSILGGMVYQGTWNATTNTPTLTSGTGTKGWFYKVSVAGSTMVDGISQWNVGDEIAFDGTTWDKFAGIASEVLSVNGQTGAVTGLATLASPTFTGTPAVPTAAVDTSTTQAASTAYVVGQGYLKSTTAASTYAPLASPAFTGSPSINRANGEGDLLLGQNDGYFFGNTTQAGWYSPTHGSWAYDFAAANLKVGANAVWHAGNTPTKAPGDNSTALATTAFVTAAVAPFSGKNRIINGNCNIAQRGPFVATTGAGGYGGPDRFAASNGGSAGGQFTQSQGTITWNGVAKAAVVQTVNTAVSSLSGSNYWSGISQPIEGFNCFDLLGKPVPVSFIFQTNVTGTFTVTLRDGGNANSYISTFSATANTPVKVVIPVSALSTSLSIPNSAAAGLAVSVGALNQGAFQTSTLNAWQSGNFVSANTATNWGATAGNYIALTELQLEAGTVATPFDERSYGAEFALCQRYYEVGNSPLAVLWSGQCTNGSAYYTTTKYCVTKRASPTVVYASPQYLSFSGITQGANSNVDSLETFATSNATNASGYFGSGFTASAEL
jgi:hypothetical protein